MKHFLTAVACLAILSNSPSLVAQTTTQATRELPLFENQSVHHPVVATNGMVASQERLASQVGVEILKKGGNAVDAAVAVGFALAVTLPRAGNIAGGGFMMVYLADEKRTIAIDYKEMAPAAATSDMFVKEDGTVDLVAARFSHLASGIPGTVAAFEQVLKKYGSMSLNEVVTPARTLARDGITVSYDLSQSIEFAVSTLGKDPESRKIFYKADGSALAPGETLTQSDLADSLELIGREGGKAFYEGSIARAIVKTMHEHGGIMTLADLQSFKALEREPVRFRYHDYELVIMPPPSSGGIHIAQILNVMDLFDIENTGPNTAQTIHIMTEAMRQAYADRSEFLGDPDFVDIPSEWLMSQAYAKEIAAEIPENRARSSKEIKPGTVPAYESPDTTHFSVIDRNGNMVANTYSLNFSYGSGITVPGTGILLNNVMDDFSANPGTPNAYGLLGGEANSVQPMKRPLSSMTPTLVFKDGEPFMATGSPGGSRIITSVLQVLVNVIDHDMNFAQATATPRFHHQWYPDVIFVEPGINRDTIRLLETMGYTVESFRAMGSVQTVGKIGRYLYGAFDPRRPGAAAIGY